MTRIKRLSLEGLSLEELNDELFEQLLKFEHYFIEQMDTR